MIAEPYRRPPNSHVSLDGSPKAVYETREAAVSECHRVYLATGGMKRLFPYECWQKPTHFHLSKQVSDLRS